MSATIYVEFLFQRVWQCKRAKNTGGMASGSAEWAALRFTVSLERHQEKTSRSNGDEFGNKHRETGSDQKLDADMIADIVSDAWAELLGNTFAVCVTRGCPDPECVGAGNL